MKIIQNSFKRINSWVFICIMECYSAIKKNVTTDKCKSMDESLTVEKSQTQKHTHYRITYMLILRTHKF